MRLSGNDHSDFFSAYTLKAATYLLIMDFFGFPRLSGDKSGGIKPSNMACPRNSSPLNKRVNERAITLSSVIRNNLLNCCPSVCSVSAAWFSVFYGNLMGSGK